MGSMSLIHWIIVGAVLLLVFGGRNKISDVMGDVAKGIKSFKKGLADDDEPKAVPPSFDPARSIDHQPGAHPYQAPQPYAPAQQPYQPMPQASQPYPQNGQPYPQAGQPYQPQAHPFHPQTEPVARAEPVEPHKAG